MINDHYSPKTLNKKVLDIAKKISSKSNLTIKIGKKGFYKQLEMPLGKAYDYTSKMMTLNMSSYDAKEGYKCIYRKKKSKLEKQITIKLKSLKKKIKL